MSSRAARRPAASARPASTAGPPALRNAIYAATGVALRRLPIDRSLIAGKKVMSPGARRILPSVVAIAAVALAVGVWIIRGPGPMAFADGPKVALADYKAADPTGVPASLAKASLVERGAYLARAADCMVCHTTQGGKEYAGGSAFKLPFGTLYSTNITPDKETGIGNYSDQDFLNAVHRGIRRDGARLYPAMPYTSYTYITDADALAIKAYLFSLAPVHARRPANTLTFPFNQRWAMTFWSALFNPDTRFEPDTLEDVRNGTAAPISPKRWRIAANAIRRATWRSRSTTARNSPARSTAGWRAFNISSDKATGVGGWSDEDLVVLFVDRACRRPRHRLGTDGRSGRPQLQPAGAGRHPRRGRLSCAACPPFASPDLPATLAPPAPASHRDGGNTADARGKMVFEGACVSCHGWTGESAISPFATLTGAWAVNDPGATNVAQIVISGTKRHTPKAPSRCRRSATPIPMPRSRRSPIMSPRASAARDRRSPRRTWRS